MTPYLRKTMRGVCAAAALTFSLLAALPASADHHESGHEGHSQHSAAETGAPKAGAAELSEASKAFEGAMTTMHKDMMVPYTNDVDLDFVRGMIPHHQGAIDQAQILLKYSKNPRLRRLAGGIIAAQKREITFMKYWMAEHEKGVESNEMPVWLRADPAIADEPVNPAAKPQQ